MSADKSRLKAKKREMSTNAHTKPEATRRVIEGVMRVIPAGYRIARERGGYVPYAPDGLKIIGPFEFELMAVRVCEAHEAGEFARRAKT